MRGQERDCSECKSAQDLPMFVLSVCHQAAEFCKCPVTGRALIRIAVSTRISISICNHQPLKLLHMLVLAHKVLDRFLSFFFCPRQFEQFPDSKCATAPVALRKRRSLQQGHAAVLPGRMCLWYTFKVSFA
mmetsp:Transcript_39080/g.61503  ORF Transcript_39080/g.61503 Transcript_39080/m.61503 type:complete len:131 (-) Transcript_39080:77-469(-)